VRLLLKGFLLAWLIVALAYLPAARAQNAVPDADQSTRLTDYLHAHRLPLVGAQVLNSGGGRSVMLYGYTATEFGKGDAEAKTRQFLRDSSIVVSNHIHVRPELASMRSPSRSASSAYPYSGTGAAPSEAPPAEATPPDVAAYQNQQQDYINQQTQQYMNQGNSASSLTSALIPLLGMGLAIGLGGSGSGFGMGVSPGFGSFGGSPFSSSPFGGSQYGSPYGGSPYGGSPYGGAPYGGTPYGYPSGPSPYGGPSNPYP
jgi:hypothetical protein